MDKEISYFLNEEDRLCNISDANVDFLRDKPFANWWKIMQDGKGLTQETRKKFNITDAEELVFWLMIGKESLYFREDKGNECRRKMIDIWERFLSKTPNCESIVVQRYLKFHDRMNFKIGEIWECPFSLTCTTNTESYWPLNDNESLYEIHLLNNGNTKAKSVFEIYNNGIDCDNAENQVNFPKNTKFKIEDINEIGNGGKRIILHEI